MFWNQGSLSNLSRGNSQGYAYSAAETQLQLQILGLCPYDWLIFSSHLKPWGNMSAELLHSLLARAFHGGYHVS